MASVIENMNRAKDALTNVKSAIIEKGIDIPTGTPVEEYGALIGNIVGGDGMAVFWEDYQASGARTDYNYAWSNVCWTDKYYKPNYTITPSTCIYCYFKSKITDTKVDIIPQAGANIKQLFHSASSLKRIQRLVVDETITYGSSTWESPFYLCSALEELNIEGTIGANIIFQSSTKLNKESITKLINCLSDTTTGKTFSITKTAIRNAFTSETNEEWLALVATKPNWTISLT